MVLKQFVLRDVPEPEAANDEVLIGFELPGLRTLRCFRPEVSIRFARICRSRPAPRSRGKCSKLIRAPGSRSVSG